MPRTRPSRLTARLRPPWPTADGRQPTASRRRGLTLIEMLMATAITLLMMAAVVTLFANLSGSISNRRALIELSGQLRQVRQRLARDLAGCTVPPGPQGLTPWRARPGEAIGYFEILEGDRSDARPSALVDGDTGPPGEIDYATSQVPSGGDPHSLLPQQVGRRIVQENDVTNGGALGDFDDILALTVRSLDDPFVAIVDVPVDFDGDGILDENGNGFIDDDESEEQRIESNLAEVIWYAIQTPLDDPDTDEDERVIAGVRGEPGMRTVYRRVRIVAPWLPSVPATGGGPLYDGKISLHYELIPPVAPATEPQRIAVPNTLGDLTRREYRWAHEYDFTRVDLDFPHELDLFDIPWPILTSREFAVLDNVLAFDVRVLDPGAPVYLYPGSDTTIDPVDPDWQSRVGGTPVSFGAYVDLGWNNSGTYDYTTIAGAPPTVFQQEHRLGWHPRDPNDSLGLGTRGTPATYDTWTWHYENDGRDQDGDFVLDSAGLRVDLDGDGFEDPLVDEGTNGRDDLNPDGSLGINGVDDVLERETSPPYPYPLRSVKVVLRVYERDARQIREASVINSFVP